MAALLHVKVDSKATVDQLKQAVRPMVEEFKNNNAEPLVAPPREENVAKSSAPPPVSVASSMPGVSQEDVMKLLELQDQKFRMMFEQVLNHMRSQPPVRNPPIVIEGMEQDEDEDIELVED